VGLVLDKIGTPGSGILVRKGVGARSPGGAGIASAAPFGTSTTIYGDFFSATILDKNGNSVTQTDQTRIGYLMHELGHSALGLSDQISRAGLATIGVTIATPGVNLPFDDNRLVYDVYGVTARDAAIQLGVPNNDRFVCSTGLRGGC
jgi:hypothetical protein